jgi:hypothetical protein
MYEAKDKELQDTTTRRDRPRRTADGGRRTQPFPEGETVMSFHATTVLAALSGTLMSVDIDDVELGDIMFMGGHLVRRVWTRPRDRTYHANHEFRAWQGLKLNEPINGSAARGEFQTAIGAAVLIFRESDPNLRRCSYGMADDGTAARPGTAKGISRADPHR